MAQPNLNKAHDPRLINISVHMLKITLSKNWTFYTRSTELEKNSDVNIEMTKVIKKLNMYYCVHL